MHYGYQTRSGIGGNKTDEYAFFSALQIRCMTNDGELLKVFQYSSIFRSDLE